MKKEKQMLLDDMQGQIKKSSSFIVASYKGLTAERAHAFRRGLSKNGANFEVVRKRMLVQAAKNMGLEFALDLLPGHIGLILGVSDPVEMTKFVLKFSEENDQSFDLLGGCVEGQKISAADAKRLATLPSKDQMRAEFLGLLDAPTSQLLTVIEALLSGVVQCMDSKLQGSKSE